FRTTSDLIGRAWARQQPGKGRQFSQVVPARPASLHQLEQLSASLRPANRAALAEGPGDGRSITTKRMASLWPGRTGFGKRGGSAYPPPDTLRGQSARMIATR